MYLLLNWPGCLLFLQREMELNQFLKFFLPQKGFEIIVFLIIILLFISGWFFARQSNRRSENEFKINRKDRFLKMLPAVFLTIGLLGTFIGIGLAIGSLEEITTNRIAADPLEINKVLGQLGLKFKCSVWGILASILFRIIQSYYGFEDRVQQLKSAERQKQYTDARDKSLTVLIESAGRLSHLVTLTNRIQEFISDMRSNIADISNSATRMESASRKLARSTDNFNVSVGQFESKVEIVMSQASGVLGDAGKNLKKSTDDMTIQLSRTFTDFSSGINRTLLKIEQSMTGITNDIKNSQQNSTRQISEATGQLKESVDWLTKTTFEQSQKTTASLNLLNQYLNKLQVAAETLSVKTEQQDTVMVMLKESTERLVNTWGKAYIDNLERSTELREGLNTINQKLENNSQKLQRRKAHQKRSKIRKRVRRNHKSDRVKNLSYMKSE